MKPSNLASRTHNMLFLFMVHTFEYNILFQLLRIQISKKVKLQLYDYVVVILIYRVTF